MARWDNRTCRRCGGHYKAGHYGEHTRGLAHQRQVVLDAKIRREKERAGK